VEKCALRKEPCDSKLEAKDTVANFVEEGPLRLVAARVLPLEKKTAVPLLLLLLLLLCCRSLSCRWHPNLTFSGGTIMTTTNKIGRFLFFLFVRGGDCMHAARKANEQATTTFTLLRYTHGHDSCPNPILRQLLMD